MKSNWKNWAGLLGVMVLALIISSALINYYQERRLAKLTGVNDEGVLTQAEGAKMYQKSF